MRVPLWDSWYVDEELGEGRSGKVYKVHKTCYAAVKIIHVPQSDDEIARALLDMPESGIAEYFHGFVMDIVNAVCLMMEFEDRKNIVSIDDYEVVRRDNLHWDILVRMELLQSLPSYITEHFLTNNDVIRLGLDISHALELYAMKGITPSGIKPDNILVSEYGDFKLDIDLGRYAERDMFHKGVRSYAAPEVLREEPHDIRADLYSLGIIMYRFLNMNRLPFMPLFPEPLTLHSREEALQRRMRGDELPDIPDIDPTLNAFIIKACAYRPEERYQTAGEFRAELERVRDILKGE